MPKESKDKPERNKSTKSSSSSSGNSGGNQPKLPQSSETGGDKNEKERDPKATFVASEALAEDGGGSRQSPIFTPTMMPRSSTSFQHLHQPMVNSGAQFLPGMGMGSYQAYPGASFSEFPLQSVPMSSALNGRMDRLETHVNTLAQSIHGLTRALTGRMQPPNPADGDNIPYEDVSEPDDGELGDNVDVQSSSGCPNFTDLAFPTPSKAEPIDDELADFAAKACTVEPDPEVLANILKEFIQPENCKYVVAPELESKLLVNDLQPYLKARERDLVSAQNDLVHGMYGLLNLTASLQILQSESDHDVFSELTDTARKTLLLCGHTSLALSKLRKQNLKSVFNPRFDKVCSNATEITTKLFGDDLIKSCKDTAEESAAMDKVLRAIKPNKSFSRAGRKPQYIPRAQHSFVRNTYPSSHTQQNRFKLAAASRATFKRGGHSRLPSTSRAYHKPGNYSQSRAPKN